MATLSAFYTFSYIASNGDRYAIAYKPPGPMERGAYEELFVSLCNGPRIPDAIALVVVADDAVDALSDISADAVKSALERLRGRIPLLMVIYDLASGKVKVNLHDDTFEKQKERLFVPLRSAKAWLRSGLFDIFNEDVVVLRAPSGYTYEKPSGARTTIFLKPDLALTSSATIAFVALALFQKNFSGRISQFKELRTIFVDTMAIAPVAYELGQLLLLCSESIRPHIESFHSYGGFEGVRLPMRGTSFCLISASTSMDLHEKWITHKEVSPAEVVTLITLKGVTKYKAGALTAIDCSGLATAEGPVQLSIRIRGETFLPEQEPAKKILLTDQHHGCAEDVEKFCMLTGQKIFDVFRRGGRSAAKVRALFVDGEELLKAPRFNEWLEAQLFQTVKASTKLIVHQDDKASKELAERIAEYCRKNLQLAPQKVVSLNDLRNAEFPKSSGVIACGAVVGKGSQLLEVSRMLRDLHEGPRLFVVGFQVAESRGEIKGLTSNLKHSKGVPHEVVKFGHAAIGTQLLASYEQEQAMYYPASRDLIGLPSAMKQRGAALGGAQSVGSLSLLPYGLEVDGSMRLRSGFAYWPPFGGDACQPSVIATMAVLLQRAREEKLPEERRLATASYRHVVLDPENFARFNDGVIQSALLRVAYPSELDYRSDNAASGYMKSIIVRSLSKAEGQAGEPILEFIGALAMKRLQVVQQHMDEILKAAHEAGARSQSLKAAIHFLLSPPGKKSKIPF